MGVGEAVGYSRADGWAIRDFLALVEIECRKPNRREQGEHRNATEETADMISGTRQRIDNLFIVLVAVGEAFATAAQYCRATWKKSIVESVCGCCCMVVRVAPGGIIVHINILIWYDN